MMTRLLGAILLASFLVVTGGCVHPCLALAEELCECEETQGERDSCKNLARRIFDQAPSDDTKEARAECSELLDICDCEFVATEQGKRDCGIALDQ